MKITVGFSTTNLLISKVIRYYTASDISHCYFKFFDEYLMLPLVFHSDSPGVVLVHGNQFAKNNIIFEEYTIEDPKLEAAFKRNLGLLGKPTNRLAMLLWLWEHLVSWVKRSKHTFSFPNHPEKLLCVELVGKTMQEAGFPISDLTPHDMRIWFEKMHKSYGWTRKVFKKAQAGIFD